MGKAPTEISVYLSGWSSAKQGDIHLIVVREALCQLISKWLCAAVKIKHQSFFYQQDVACPFGAENIMHDLSTCILTSTGWMMFVSQDRYDKCV